MFSLLGFTSKKSKVSNLKDLCFSKTKMYPWILKECGTVMPCTDGVNKPLKRLLPGEMYVISPQMFSAILIDKQQDGQNKLRPVCCSPAFVSSLDNGIMAAASS